MLTPGHPDTVVTAQSSHVLFRVSEDAITRFAALTGDRSSLHVSESFARRSAYRRPIAHGMLPVGFLAALGSFRRDGYFCAPTAVTGRFVSPVFAGEHLRLTATPQEGASSSRETTFDYRIEHEDSRRLATVGTVTVAYTSRRAPPKAGRTLRLEGAVLSRPVELSAFLIEQLDVGKKDAIDFRVTEGAVGDFIELLRLGTGDDGRPSVGELQEWFGVSALLPVLLLSTSVGVSLPGVSATFLEFVAHSLRAPEVGAEYRLHGTVTHRSMATRIVKKELVGGRSGKDDEVVLRGKVAVLVSTPSPLMPSMKELESSAADFGLKGKVALVTGASRGIGETVAKVLALAGARVIVNYHRGAADAERIVQEISAAGGEAIAVGADVTNADEVRTLVELGIQRFGAIDVLVNNAARDFRPIPFLHLTWEEIQKDLDVVAKGAFLCCRQVIPYMLEQGRGKIVNISSVATDDPPPDQTKYVMAKSALVGLTRSLSIEFASRNIQVNLVAPNFVETDFVAHIAEGFRKKLAQDTPMQRHATAIEVAQAVLYFASSLSSFTTGQKLMVTGGGAPYA